MRSDQWPDTQFCLSKNTRNYKKGAATDKDLLDLFWREIKSDRIMLEMPVM